MTKNPLRIILAILFALWAIGCFAILSPLSWAIGIMWGCFACRMATHKWPAGVWRDYKSH